MSPRTQVQPNGGLAVTFERSGSPVRQLMGTWGNCCSPFGLGVCSVRSAPPRWTRVRCASSPLLAGCELSIPLSYLDRNVGDEHGPCCFQSGKHPT